MWLLLYIVTLFIRIETMDMLRLWAIFVGLSLYFYYLEEIMVRGNMIRWLLLTPILIIAAIHFFIYGRKTNDD